MRDWNVLVTVAPGPGRKSRLLRRLRGLGWFEPTEFKNVCLGDVEDRTQFLETLRVGRENDEPWLADLARAIPVEQTFSFIPEDLTEQMKQAAAPFIGRMRDGTFYVREHLLELAETAGKRLQVSFANPDYIVAAETVGNECGIALLDRALIDRCPFVLPH
jgi:tRNA(Ser,Leu) C12 N-acetylase TAN1